MNSFNDIFLEKPGEEEDSVRRQNLTEEAPKIIEMQKTEIRRLRNEVGK